MTSEETACETLLGAKLGSIRMVRYAAASSTLEIETKTGRFVHVAPTHSGACVLATGPAPAPSTDAMQSVRHWTDLTGEVPFAFDGRPVVERAQAMNRDGIICGCIIEFSNGRRLACDFSSGEPRLATE